MPRQFAKNTNDPNRYQKTKPAGMEDLRSSSTIVPVKLASAAPKLEQSQVRIGQISFGQGANNIGGLNTSAAIADILSASIELTEAGVKAAEFYATSKDEDTAKKMKAEMEDVTRRNKTGTPEEQTDEWFTAERERIFSKYENQFITRRYKTEFETPRFENELASFFAPVQDSITSYKRKRNDIALDPSYNAMGEAGEIQREKDLTALNQTFYEAMKVKWGDNNDAMEAVIGALGGYTRNRPADASTLANRILQDYSEPIEEQIELAVVEMAKREQMYESEAAMAADILQKVGMPDELRNSQGGALEALFLEKYQKQIKRVYDSVQNDISTAILNKTTSETSQFEARASATIVDGGDASIDLTSYEQSISDEWYLQPDEEVAEARLESRLRNLFDMLSGVYYDGTPEENRDKALSDILTLAGDLGVDIRNLPNNFYAYVRSDRTLQNFTVENQPSTALVGRQLNDRPTPALHRDRVIHLNAQATWVENVVEAAARYTTAVVLSESSYAVGLAETEQFTARDELENALVIALNEYATTTDDMDIINQRGRARFQSTEAQNAFSVLFTKALSRNKEDKVLREAKKLINENGSFGSVYNESLKWQPTIFAGPSNEAGPAMPPEVSPISRFESEDVVAAAIRPTEEQAISQADIDGYVTTALNNMISNKDLMAYYDTLDGDTKRATFLRRGLENSGVATTPEGIDSLIKLLKAEEMVSIRASVEANEPFYAPSLNAIVEEFTTEQYRQAPQYQEFVTNGAMAVVQFQTSDPDSYTELIQRAPAFEVSRNNTSLRDVFGFLYEAGIQSTDPQQILQILKRRGIRIANVGEGFYFSFDQTELNASLQRVPIAVTYAGRVTYNDTQGPANGRNSQTLNQLEFGDKYFNTEFGEVISLVRTNRVDDIKRRKFNGDPIVTTLLSDDEGVITLRTLASAWLVDSFKLDVPINPKAVSFSIDSATGNLSIGVTIGKTRYEQELPPEFTILLDLNHQSSVRGAFALAPKTHQKW